MTAYSCVMNTHKNDLSRLSTRALLARRRRLAARFGDAEQVLAGSLVEQTRRCGKPGCRCAAGEPHGPYAYFAPKAAGRGRCGMCRRRWSRWCGAAARRQVEAVLAEISAINAELLARRELR